MKKSIPCLLALVAPLTAGELLPSQIPASAKWLLHVDLDAMRASETGKAVFERIEADHSAKLRAFKRMFSVHLIDDLRDVTLFGDGKKDHAVILFDGTFDRTHMEDVLKAADDYTESDHAGFTIHTWKDKGTTQHAAFATQDLLVFSRQDDLLRQELDVLKTNAPAGNNPILPKAGSKPLISAGAKLAEIEMPADSARFLHNASLLEISAHENAGRFSIRMGAETPDAPRAKRMQRILDGMLALAEADNPDLTTAGFQCDITISDPPGVSASVSMPVPEWLALMKKEADKKKKKH